MFCCSVNSLCMFPLFLLGQEKHYTVNKADVWLSNGGGCGICVCMCVCVLNPLE